MLWSTVGALHVSGDPANTGETEESVALRASPGLRYRGDLESAQRDTGELVGLGWRVVLAFTGPGPAERAAEQR